MFLGKTVLKIYCKFSGGHPYQSVICFAKFDKINLAENDDIVKSDRETAEISISKDPTLNAIIMIMIMIIKKTVYFNFSEVKEDDSY